jgi:HEXXH motif-containing protein
MLRQDSGEVRHIIVSLECPSPSAGYDSIPVELLPADLADQYADSDMRFFEAAEIIETGVSTRVSEALTFLSPVPTILPTICSLVRALHLIDTGDDEIDVSFSEPAIPFSAFISVPRQETDAGPLRVAEALLHEAMHLQLTLIESMVPLVTNSERTYFSPWRNEYRTAQGVLHALYVFRVIDNFLGEMSFEGSGIVKLRDHADERRATIIQQINEIRDFGSCVDLTSDGVALVTRLLG